MRRFFAFIALFFFFGFLSAQPINLAQSYFHFTLAKMHDLRREYSEAIVEFEKAISLNSQSSSLRVEFARTLWEAGEIRRAVQECKKAEELDPKNTEPHFWLGQIYSSMGAKRRGNMVDKAMAEFRRVVDLEPRHSEALYMLGQLHLVEKDFETAIDVFSRLIQVQPDFLRGYYFKAIAHVELEQMELAIRALEGSLKIRGNGFDSLKLLATLYEETGQYEKAFETYAEAMKYRSDPEVRQRLGNLLESGRSFSNVIPVLTELVSQVPENLEIKVKLGQALEEDSRFLEAREIFSEVLEKDPRHVGAQYELGRTQAELGERRQAIRTFLDLLETTDSADMEDSSGLRQYRILSQELLGLLYQQTQQFDKAIAQFREMNRNHPDHYVPRLRLVYAFKEAGRLTEALSLSDQLQGEYDQQPYVAIARARVLAAADELDRASRFLREKIKKDPGEEQLYSVLSQLYVDHRRYQDAESVVKEGLSRHPDSERIEFQLGAVYERKKQFDRAEATFKKILGRNARHAGVLNYLGYMLAEQDVRLEEALGYIKRAVEIDPYNGAYLDSLGWAYFKLNELELAEINLRSAARLNGPDATIYDHLGDLYYKLGEYDKASKYYKQSLFSAEEKEESKRVRAKLSDLKEFLSQKR